MWMVVRVQDTEVLRDVLDQWKAGVDAHEPQKVALTRPKHVDWHTSAALPYPPETR